MVRPAVLAACLAFLPIAAHAAEERGAMRTFRDWAVGCDNGRVCQALSLLAEDTIEGWFLRLDRGAAAAAPVRLTLMPQSETYPRAAALRLRAAGADVATLTIGEGIRLGDNGLIIEDRGAVAAVLAAMKSAETLELVFEQRPAGAEQRASMSLVGAQAALLWIDERQQRLDTVTALARPGSRPASAVPAPPALPVIVPRRTTNGGPPPDRLPDATVNEMIRQSAGYCDDDRSRVDPDAEARTTMRLGPGAVLASVSCFSGPYNDVRAYFLVEEGPVPGVRPALFPRPARLKADPDAKPVPDNVLWNPDLAPNSNEISHFAKGRGLADCGETGVWRWDGRAFQAFSLTAMDSCRGIAADSWPRIYSSRE